MMNHVAHVSTVNSYIQINNKKYNLPSDCSLSSGNSCQTKERRMSDGTKTSYAITSFVKPAANTYSLSFVLTSNEYPDLMRELYDWESLVGKTGNFNYCNIPFGDVIITDMSATFQVDGTLGITAINISFNLKDNIVITRKAENVNVRLV